MKTLECGQGVFWVRENDNTNLFNNFIDKGIRMIGHMDISPKEERANHYHKNFIEIICVVKGKLRIKLYMPDNPSEVSEIVLSRGDEITILPPLAHSFKSDDGAIALEYSPHNYTTADSFKVDFDW